MTNSSATKQTRPSIGFTLCTLIIIVILCGLGYWQLERLKEKTTMLSIIEQQNVMTVPELPDLHGADMKQLSENKEFLFQPGHVTGLFQPEQSFVLEPRTYQGRNGYHLITPVTLIDSDHVLLVNRGWISDKSARHTVPAAVVRVYGALRHIEKPGMFIPANQPDSNIWHAINMDALPPPIENPDKVLPFMFYMMQDGSVTTEPVPFTQDALTPPNNHKQYALFWFSMAGIMLIIFLLKSFRKAPEHSE